jgi:hypothetical protein
VGVGWVDKWGGVGTHDSETSGVADGAGEFGIADLGVVRKRVLGEAGRGFTHCMPP